MAKDRRRDDSPPGDPAEGVRIIGAEEAAEAIERGDVAERRGAHMPRYGDRPARPPAGPKPALRFPLDAGAEAEAPSLRPAKGTRFDPRPPPAWDEPEVAEDDEADPWPADATWGDAAEWSDDSHDDVVAWTRGETGTLPAVEVDDAPEPEQQSLSWADDFVDPDDAWDGSWDEPTGAVAWADDATPAAPEAPEPAEEAPEPATAEALDDADVDDEWQAFGAEEEEAAEAPRRGRRFFSRRDRGAADAEATPEPDTDAGAEPVVIPADEPAIEEPEPEADDDLAPVAVESDDDLEPATAEHDVVAPAVPDATWAPPADDEPATVDAEDDLGDIEDDVPIDGPIEAALPIADEEDADVVDEPEVTREPDAPWGEPSWGADVVTAGGDADDDDSAPLFDADGGWAERSGEVKVFDFADEPSGQVELPHWTEPATGELPRIFVEDDDAAVDPEPSGSVPVAHWRTHDGAWGDEGFDDLTEDDDDLRLGALDDERPHDDELYDFDELDEIVAEPEPEDDDGPVVVGAGRRLPPARPVPEPEAPRGGAGRNLGVAAVVGLALVGVALLLMNFGPGWVMLMVVPILVIAIGEYQAAVQRAGYRPATLLGIAAAALFPIATHLKGVEAYPVLLVVTVAACLAWHLVGAEGDARVVESVGVTLLGIGWIAGFGSFAGLLLGLPDGVGMLVAAILAAVAYDVGGLLIGRTMGATPLSDASPNKTVEGLVGGMLMSLFAVFVVVGMFGIAPWGSLGDSLKIGIFAALAAPLGDLCESLIKRDLGVKDMGDLLPEHGGLLDRFDALLFVLPAVFFAAMFFQIAPF